MDDPTPEVLSEMTTSSHNHPNRPRCRGVRHASRARPWLRWAWRWGGGVLGGMNRRPAVSMTT